MKLFSDLKKKKNRFIYIYRRLSITQNLMFNTLQINHLKLNWFPHTHQHQQCSA